MSLRREAHAEGKQQAREIRAGWRRAASPSRVTEEWRAAFYAGLLEGARS